MKNIGLCSILTIMTLTFFIIGYQNAFSEETKMHENRNAGIILSYPSDWVAPYDDIATGEPCFIFEKFACLIQWTNLVNIDPLESWGFMISVSSSESPKFLELCDCQTLTELMKRSYELAKFNAESRNKDFKFINDNQTSVDKNNYSAWQMEIAESSNAGNEAPEKKLFVFVKINTTFYEIRFDTFGLNEFYSKELPRVKEVIKSIEFLPIQKNVTKVPSFMNASSMKSE